MKKLFQMGILSRTAILWFAFFASTWIIFGTGVLTHPENWENVPPVARETGWEVFWFIILNNCLIMLLIAGGNIFVRFGLLTPGLVVLVIQAVTIGWTAGTNSFMEPFPSVAAANEAFLRIGLWETTAYVLICAATLSKSLLVADTFPAKKWVATTPLKELRFSLAETRMAAAGVLVLIGSAYVEAFL
jgi:hypothetical protein